MMFKYQSRQSRQIPGIISYMEFFSSKKLAYSIFFGTPITLGFISLLLYYFLLGGYFDFFHFFRFDVPFLWEIWSNIPILKSVQIREDRPKLIKGRGNPVGGPNPSTMLIFSKAWRKMAKVRPAAAVWLNKFGAFHEIKNPLQRMTRNKSRTVRVPIRPSSSPTIA